MGPDSDNSNLKRRTSKLGLLGLFNRSKIALDVETPQEKLETQWEGILSTERPLTKDPASSFVPAENELTPIQETPDMSLQRRPSRGALRNRQSFKKETSSSASDAWNAPPLFQAYPQSVKHATLKAPLMSAEAILRLSNERNRANEGQSAVYGDGEEPQKKDKKLRKSTTLDVIAKGEWVEKIYVLVTAGYLLQYAGHGAYDRVPEKIMHLSETSAAFASDAIPGKHFVLQISQVSNEDGTIDPEISRSMFKKMGGLRGEMRRSVANFLLVLQNPEEMSEWLVAVRKEIEALGGKEYKPEMPWDEDNAETPVAKQPQRMPSQRYLVKRNPHQFEDKPWEPPHDVSLGDKVIIEEKPQEITRMPALVTGNRQSITTQKSADSRYVSDTQASIDQVHLDRLRESYASTAENTTSTSRDSSPQRSPLLGSQDTIAELPAKPFTPTPTSEHLETGSLSSHTLSDPIIADRESLQPTPTPTSRPISTVVSPPPERTMSPAPNFSVPSFSKRYSAASTSPAPSTKATSPPPITILEDLPHAQAEDESYLMDQERGSTLGELQAHYKSSPRPSMRISSAQPSSYLSTPPTSSHSHDRPSSSSDGDRPYSRRFSSLDYARGISPVKPTHHSPFPHPPPTASLPPLPDGGNASKRASLIPPPTAPPTAPLPSLPGSRGLSLPPPAPPPTMALPPIPTERRASSRASTPRSARDESATPPQPRRPSPANSVSPFPPPTTPLPEVPGARRSPTPSAKHQSSRDSSRSKLTKAREPRCPSSVQVRGPSQATPPSLPQTAIKPTFTIEHQALSESPINNLFFAPQLPPPPKPIRAPPPPPSMPPPPPPTRTLLPSPPPAATEAPEPAIESLPPPPSPLPISLPSRPPTPPKISRKSVPKIGREPPPVYSPRFYSKSNKTPVESPIAEKSLSTVKPLFADRSPVAVKFPAVEKIAAVSPVATSSPPQLEVSHSFIPPIRISHTRERGSFDGPWNAGYGGEKRGVWT